MITFEQQQFQEVLGARIARLQAITDSAWPSNPAKDEVHARKVAAAKRYLAELRSLDSVLCPTGEVHVLANKTFESRLAKADIATIVDEGEFFRMAEIANFPSSQYLAITFTPINSLGSLETL